MTQTDSAAAPSTAQDQCRATAGPSFCNFRVGHKGLCSFLAIYEEARELQGQVATLQRELAEASGKIEEIEKQRLNWAQPLRDRLDAQARELEAAKTVVEATRNCVVCRVEHKRLFDALDALAQGEPARDMRA